MGDGPGSFRTDASSKTTGDQRTTSRYAESNTTTAHKRSTSGHPNPTLRSANSSFEERERRTEKVHVTTRETFTTRTRSPPRRTAPAEKTRGADGPKQRPQESRPRDARQETPIPGAPLYTLLLLLLLLLSGHVHDGTVYC